MKKMWNKKMKNIFMAWILVISMVVPMCATGVTAKAENTSLKDYNAMTMEQILNSEESLTWVFAGDSITHNGSWSQGMNSYSEWFEQYLYDIDRDDDAVVLTAWGGADIYDFQYAGENTPGETSNGAENNAGMGLENMITKYNPDVVFIKLGMNDRGKSTAEFTKYYNMMLDGVYAEGLKNNKIPKVVLLTPTPLSGENLYDDSVYPDPSASIQDNTLRHRNAIEKIAKERGLLFCDLRTAFLNEQIRLGADYRRTFFSDPSDGGIHPNAAGQYLIFKTLSKVLGIYDEEKELYQIEYADADSAALYVDGTSGVTYTNEYDVPKYTEEVSVDDGIQLLAYVDFNTNGISGNFVGGTNYANATRIPLTESTTGNDALTLGEVQSLGKEFTVVFRAKLDIPDENKANQAVLFISPNGKGEWDNALSLGVPGKNDDCYYRMDGVLSANGSISMNGTNVTGDGDWHTIAIVQTANTFTYYIDGEQHFTKNLSVNSNIGDAFKNATDFTAYIGSYSQNDGPTYNLKGNMDYYQFYKGALSAEQIAKLADDIEMNKTMTTVSGTTPLSSVEFTSSTGDLVYNSTDVHASTVDLTNEATGVNTLTVEELATVGKEYSVAFRAKLNSAKENQPIIYLSTKAGTAFGSGGHNLLMLGVPGNSNLYYAVRENGQAKATLNTSTTTYGSLKTDMNDKEWHTVVMVQSESGMTAYVDGTAYAVTTNGGEAITLSKPISELFANITNAQLDAAVGRYDTTSNTWKTQGKFDYWQFYGKALSAAEVASLNVNKTVTEEMNATMPTLPLTRLNTVTGVDRTHTWTDTVGETFVWAVAGAEQMSGYEGPVVNRSLFRLLDNVMRGGGSIVASMRDVRLINLAKPGNTVASMYNNYDATIGEHNHNVLLVLPEISQVYAEGYVHSDALVEEYKSALKNLIAKENGIVVLWTPLASDDETINSYIDDYADAVRRIAVEDGRVLFFDANKFMNDNMSRNEVLTRNWFEEDMYISPLCAVDLATSFYQTLNLSNTGIGEVTGHNLRLTSDVRKFKGEYVRDYIPSSVTVNGTKVTIDVSAIKEEYPNAMVWLSVLPTVGTGNFNKNIVDLTDVTDVAVNGNKFTFEAPCSDPVIAVYASVGSYIYRFKDVEVDVETTNVIGDIIPEPEAVFLNELEVVGAPALEYDAEKTSYDVTLYQYQRSVQILAEANPKLTITVNGEEVESGEYSQLITVDDTATVTVNVSGTVGGSKQEKTYTLNLVRPEYPDIIITEVMQDGYGNYDEKGGDNYELIEIYNASGKELNLKDYSIGYKKDYRYTGVATSGDATNYYFTGNNQAFQSTSGAVQTYTGINKITKYSSYWSDNTVTEPEEINFPADATMVIWVKFASGGTEYAENLTYDTLIAALEAEKDEHTLSVNGKAVVPTLDQLVVAEIPKGTTVGGVQSSNQPAAGVRKNFYMDNHGAENEGSAVRSWLFILGADATQSTVGAITEEGNNIISASKHGRLNSTDMLSSVFYYDVDRGMSVVKDEAYYDGSTVGEGHTSDQQGYSNLTSFGAIEYWQKPYDYTDKVAPKVTNTTKAEVAKGFSTSIKFEMIDETDLRYLELYVMKDGEVNWTKVTQDYVIQSCIANDGVARAVTGTKTFTYDLGEVTGTTQYYAVVSDGINVVELGSEDKPLEINVSEETATGEIGTKMTVEVNGDDVEIIVGDVNGDSRVNITDFVLVNAHLLKKRVLTDEFLLASDVNHDGRTNITDFVLINRYLLKQGK